MSTTKKNIFYAWVITVSCGEFIGFSIPSLIGILTVSAHLTQSMQTLLMIAAGICEGAVLGFAQSLIIRRIFPRIESQRWIAVTAAAAGFAWSIGMLPSTFSDVVENMPLNLLIPLGLLLGSVLLVSIGFVQHLVLQNFVSNSLVWVWGNSLAWVAGLTALFLVMSVAPDGFLPTLIFSILGGLCMALVMAVITGHFLLKLKFK